MGRPMSELQLQTRAGEAVKVLFLPLILSLMPAMLADDVFRFRIASLPIGYLFMITLTLYLALKTRSHRINYGKYTSLIIVACLLAIYPLQITTNPLQHLAAAGLIIYNLYLYWVAINLGAKTDSDFIPNFYRRLSWLLLSCLIIYFCLEQFIRTTPFPNILPFFFYRGAEGGFLISLLAISMFELLQRRKSQGLKLSIILLLIAIFMLESRTTYVAAFIVISFSLLPSVRGIFMFCVGMCFVVTLLNFMPNIADRVQQISEISRLVSLNLELARTDGASMYRIIFWSGSLEIIKEFWLTGIGFSTKDINNHFPIDLLKLKPIIPRPHNTFLSIFMGCGVIGATTYFAILFSPVISTIKISRMSSQPGRAVIIGYFISFTLLMFTNDVETNPQILVVFGFTIGYFKYNYSRAVAKRFYSNSAGSLP